VNCEAIWPCTRMNLLVFGLGITPSPLLLINISQQGMRLNKRWVQFQCLAGRTDHFGAKLTRRSPGDAGSAELAISPRQANISRCKRRVLLNGVFKIADAFLHACAAVVSGELALEIALINLRRDLARGGKSGAFSA